jgi:hypothetical protein
MKKIFKNLILLLGLSASLLLPALERRFGEQRHSLSLVEKLIRAGGPEADSLLSLSGKGFVRDGKRGPAVQAAFVEQAAFRSGDAVSLAAAALPFYSRPLFLEREAPMTVSAAKPGHWTLLSLQRQEDAYSVQLPAGHSKGWLYLSQPYSPGWTAQAEGGAREVLRAERAFLAVPVLLEDKRLRLRFKPFSFYFGFGISLLTLAFLIWPVAFRTRTPLGGS